MESHIRFYCRLDYYCRDECPMALNIRLQEVPQESIRDSSSKEIVNYIYVYLMDYRTGKLANSTQGPLRDNPSDKMVDYINHSCAKGYKKYCLNLGDMLQLYITLSLVTSALIFGRCMQPIFHFP